MAAAGGDPSKLLPGSAAEAACFRPCPLLFIKSKLVFVKQPCPENRQGAWGCSGLAGAAVPCRGTAPSVPICLVACRALRGVVL